MEKCLTLADAAAKFMAGLSPTERDAKQQEVYRFCRWFGFDRTLDQIKPPEIGRYSEHISSASGDAAAALEPVRAFLAYARKAGLTESNYSVHLRAKRASASRGGRGLKASARPALQVNMSAEGFAALESELLTLEGERPKIVEEIQKAAADKDFRENAPLHAARERQGYLEGRIREIEATIKAAKVVAEQNGDRIGPGDYVVLKEVGCDDELCLTVVHATEANSAKGRISLASPIGKAVIGHKIGDTVQVSAPAGTLRYHVAAVERNRRS
ncbi:MAG: transcription elongation factor GreA [Dehalococcoidia bacterium]|nr:transcription elongation factor GreA [Dehalococcoidia bacterium]